MLTLFAVCYAWVWFRADSFAQAYWFTLQLFDLPAAVQQVGQLGWLHLASVLFFAVLVLVHTVFRSVELEQWFGRMHPAVLCLLLSVLVVCTVLSPGDGNAFIYFQF